MGLLKVSLLLLAIATLAYCRSAPKPFIIGGEPALSGEFPFQVSLRNVDDGWGHICGGALLSPNLIITAAVCVVEISPTIHQIVAGTLQRNQTLPWEQVRTINMSISHPEFNPATLDNDLCLIFLNEPFVFNENISAIPLPPAYVETAPNPVLHIGWGNEAYFEPLHDQLQKVVLDTFTDMDCERRLEQYVSPKILCTGAEDGGRGGCQGDAGSPMFTMGNNSYLVAVNSHFPCPLPLTDWECICGVAGPNNENTEIAFYIDWILEQSRLYGGGL